MRRIFLILFAVYPLFLYASIEKIEIEGIYYNINYKEKTAEVTYYGDHWLFLQKPYEQKEIKIPSVVICRGDSYNVVRIGEGAFYDSKTLFIIELPETIKEIGNYAFANCVGLKDVVIPQFVTSIGDAAFKGCKSLSSVIIPNGVITIGSSAFEFCDNLNSVLLSEQLTEIASSLFGDCQKVESIIIPQSVKCINQSAFRNCSKLSSVTIHEGLEVIDDLAFYGDRLLSDIVFPSTLTSIGKSAFENCSSLTAVYLLDNLNYIGDGAFKNSSIAEMHMPDGLSEIKPYTFYNCSALERVNIPLSTKTIGTYAFSYCKKLSSIDLPEGLSAIHSFAFYGCEGITKLILPLSITKMEEKAFAYCDLDYILVKNLNVKCTDIFTDMTYRHALLYVPYGMRNSAVYDSDWYQFNNIYEIAKASSELSYSKIYNIMENRTFNYLIYDNDYDQVQKVDSFSSIEENSINNNWKVITDGCNNYLFNMGVQKYMISDYQGNLSLSSEKKSIEMENTEDGIIIGLGNEKKWYFVENIQYKNFGTGTMIGSSSWQDIHDSQYYMLNGFHIKLPQKGILIERKDNGIVRKILK